MSRGDESYTDRAVEPWFLTASPTEVKARVTAHVGILGGQGVRPILQAHNPVEAIETGEKGADFHSRWCGRKGVARLPPIPISLRKSSFLIDQSPFKEQPLNSPKNFHPKDLRVGVL